MTAEPRWLTPAMVEAFHGESVARFGGPAGLRDAGLLESALARPRHRWRYDRDATVFDLAADYACGLIGNHPFIDGNKRAGFLAAVVFLSLNGWELVVEEAEIVAMILAVAAGEQAEAALAHWLMENSRPIEAR